MCTIACPYGRLQNVLTDTDTVLVAYDERRGDPKVRLKDRGEGVLAGDCIACRACVNSCPTGTDIRRGLQPECIGVAQCVDACEEVMLREGKPIGLIKFTSEREQKGGVQKTWRPRTIIYLALMTVAWGTLAVLLATRDIALVEVVRGGREPYRLLPTGEVANQQRLKFTNQHADTQTFTVEVVSSRGRRARAQRIPGRRPERPARGGERGHDGPAERVRRRSGAGPLPGQVGQGVPEGSAVPPAGSLRGRVGRAALKKLFTLVSEYRWPIYVGGLLSMSVMACAVLVFVATRPDAPRPIKGYYDAARKWDADEAVEDASRQLGWTVRYELPSGVPHSRGMPRPVDVRVADREGKPDHGTLRALLRDPSRLTRA